MSAYDISLEKFRADLLMFSNHLITDADLHERTARNFAQYQRELDSEFSEYGQVVGAFTRTNDTSTFKL